MSSPGGYNINTKHLSKGLLYWPVLKLIVILISNGSILYWSMPPVMIRKISVLSVFRSKDFLCTFNF